MQIYVAREGQQLGPYTLEQLNAEAAAGRIKSTDFAWTEGWAGWQSVSAVPGFSSAFPSAEIKPPAPPPPPPKTMPPPPPPLPGAAPSSPDHEMLLRTYVGKNYDYYSRKWAEADQKAGKNIWNWAAFFLSLWWTAYRRMYRYALIIIGIAVAESVCEYLFGFPGGASSAVNIAIAVMFGLQGNKWYRLQAEQKIREIAPTNSTDEATRLRLAQAGGTSGWAVVGFTVILFAIMFVVGALSGAARQHSDTSSSTDRAGNSKTQTVKAWKSMRQAEHDSGLENLPKAKLEDPATLKPGITFFRNLAFAYSQIDLDGVDEALTKHIKHRSAECVHFADVLESQYQDVVAAVKARESELDGSRSFGELIADDDHQKSGGAFTELLYGLATDDNFQNQLKQIQANHRGELEAAGAELDRIDQEEKATAAELSQKYGVEFVTSS